MSISADLKSRIAALDLKHPYVWRLRISSSEFAALEDAVAKGEATPLEQVAYLAEWYKRRYDGGTAKPVKDFDYQAVFEASGIAPEGNLFETEGHHKTWRYSIFVMGGLALRFEQQKPNDRLLRELCRIFYGEDGDVDQLGEKLGDKERAAAFKESVRTGGSLYEYLKEILGGHPPFAEDDLANKGSSENAFLERIKTANDAILKSKFDLEWLIRFNPEVAHMSRSLRLVMKPESLGGINHEYLAFNRVRQWGIEHPETCKSLKVAVRFLKDGEAVADPDFGKPLLEYSMTGQREAGFLAWGVERFSHKIEAPVCPFDAVEVVVKDDGGKEHAVEKFKVAEWMQVFRVPESYDVWTSRHFSQRESALLCPVGFEMLDVGSTEMICRKRFRANDGAVGETYQWRPIYDKVSFRDAAGKVTTLFNRQGYDQVVARLHPDVLRYTDGCVNYTAWNDDDCEEELLPIIFEKEDLVVRHFESHNDLCDGAFEEGACELVEFRKGGEYCEWTEDVTPPQGKVTLRLTVKGVPRKLTVYYFPGRICRDCENGKIVCGEETIDDVVVRDGTPTEAVRPMRVGSFEAGADLEIWRATKHKEFVRNGRVIKYAEDGEEVEISYALKDGLRIRDFSKDGFREYDCGDISGLYGLEEFAPYRDGCIAAYEDGIKVNVAERLDGLAPSWLWVNLAKKFAKSAAEIIYRWNSLESGLPVEVNDIPDAEENVVAFHSLKGYDGLCVCYCPMPDPNPFAFGDGGDKDTLMRWFEIATEHRLYYFLAKPVLDQNSNLLKDLHAAFQDMRQGRFSDEEERGFARFAEEMGFDMSDIYCG